MTEELFREDSYLRNCDATVVAVDGNSLTFNRTVFYPLGGGQPGDTGTLSCSGGSATIVDTRYGDDGSIVHHLEEGAAMPNVGDVVHVELDWDRRYRHMRMHTAMHLLGSVLQYGVTGGNISAEKSRLDFDMEESVDKEAVAAAIEELVNANHSVSCRWISEEELDAQPRTGSHNVGTTDREGKAVFACSKLKMSICNRAAARI